MLWKESWSHNPEAGFTLFEVMVVLTLILLLAGLIYPVSGTLNQRHLIKLSLDQLNDDLLALHAQALAGGAAPVISFKPGKAYYRIELGGSSMTRQLAGLRVATETEIIIDFSAPPSAVEALNFQTKQGVNYELTFNDQGQPIIKPK